MPNNQPLHTNIILMYIYDSNRNITIHKFYHTVQINRKLWGQLTPKKNDMQDILTHCTCDQ
jgi:hypothetical protein